MNDQPNPTEKRAMPLPGMAAIALYLLLVAGIIIVGVVAGHHYPPIFLIFSIGMLTASAGLITGFRWAWALTLATVFLLMAYNLWLFGAQRKPAELVQGLLNLVFFLYLVRPEVRERLR